MELAAAEKRKYDAVWAYRSSPESQKSAYHNGPGKGHVKGAIDRLGIKPGDSLTDYGCGNGDALRRFHDHRIDCIGVDITREAYGHDARHIPFVEAPLWSLPVDMPITDWAFSCDVLEHLPPNKVFEALAQIASRTAKGAFFRIPHRNDTLGPRLISERLHLTVRSSMWWQRAIEKFFNVREVITKNMGPTIYIAGAREHLVSTGIPADYGRIRPPKTDEAVIIVGHGPSLWEAGLGEKIDSFDKIIRFAVRQGQTVEHYGERFDYIVTSTRNHGDICNNVPKDDPHRAEMESWVFCRPGQVDTAKADTLLMRLKPWNPRICRETWPWAERYAELGATGYVDPQQGEAGMKPSFTQGCAAAIMACERINPRVLTLGGFDNLMAGTSDGFNSIHRKPHGLESHTTRHDLATERILLAEVADHYRVEIETLV